MKERPINYAKAMVLARKEGRKGMTRRVLSPQPLAGITPGFSCFSGPGAVECRRYADEAGGTHQSVIKCPYGKPGDRLWTREDHFITLWMEELGVIRLLGYYLADGVRFDVHLTKRESALFWDRKRKEGRVNGRFQYRSLARGVDLITRIRVERVQKISVEDAKDEGVESNGECYFDYIRDRYWFTYSISSFESLWKSIHSSDSWEANPWVWVIEFKPVTADGQQSCGDKGVPKCNLGTREVRV